MGRSIFAKVRHRNTTSRRNESGQSIVILALGFIALIAFVGIVVDVSLMFVRYSTLSRAVDSAAISAAGQMRKDRNYADVALAARQMIELHGLDPVQVKVDTCETAEQIDDGAGNLIDDPAVCRDGRKLVRVGSEIDSPTVFMRLLGPQYRVIRLSAVAISETAVLDVVVIFDVSESMLHDTTYEDWTSIGYGMVYVPPVWDTLDGASISYVNSDPNPHPVNQGQPLNPNGPLTSVFRISAMAGYFNALAPENADQKYDQFPDLLQFWADLLNKPQEVINRRLNYGVIGDPAPLPEIPLPPSNAYNVKSFQYPGASVAQNHPRIQCRVRFWPYSMSINIPDHILNMPGFKPLYAGRTVTNASGPPKWMGFAPSFDFYGCCNDPTENGQFNHETGAWESITGNMGDITTGPGNGRGDDNFSDLICQPFKQARDATAEFIEQVDFARGDRLAFVTFDRGATIIDPDGANGADESAALTDPNTGEVIEPVKDGRTQLTHMIETRERALDTLYRHIGVRAEANFYHWKESGGGWDDFALGLNEGTGLSDRKDFYGTDFTVVDIENADGTVIDNADVPRNDYPLRDNCPMQNASLTGFVTLYSLWDWEWTTPDAGGYGLTDNVGFAFEPGLLRIQNPSPLAGPWAATNIGVNQSYELWASCRGTNMGAALREANNALLDPNTTRRTGTVWVMVMLSDGAAGASDPVRKNGNKPGRAKPYDPLTPPKQWTGNPPGPDPAPINLIKYGLPGEYGWFGLCPFGTPTIDQSGRTQLTRTDRAPQFPFCSDTRPETRHFCVPYNGEVSNVGARCDPDSQAGTSNAYGFAPGSFDNDYDCDEEFGVNLGKGRVYDVDIGNWPNETEDTCDPLYDVDDYARDWADYVGVVRSGGGDQQLPTIFTIGFGLNFKTGSTGDPNSPDYIPGSAESNIPDFLGEELLRYIADIGDNNRIDTDYQQDLRDPGARGSLEGVITTNTDRFGLRGPCEDQDVKPGDDEIYTGDLAGNGYSTLDGAAEPGELGTMVRPLAPRTDCGNYYNAPDEARLTIVFNDIASRMFTRLAP